MGQIEAVFGNLVVSSPATVTVRGLWPASVTGTPAGRRAPGQPRPREPGFEFAQPIGEHRGPDAGEAAGEVAVAARPFHQGPVKAGASPQESLRERFPAAGSPGMRSMGSGCSPKPPGDG
jgi:hypothetical protein